MTYQFGGYNQIPSYGQQYPAPGYQKENLNWIMVPTVSDVEKVQIQPGCRSWIMVQNEPVFALRSADQMGLATTELYRFEKYTPAQDPTKNPDYVTRAQMEKAITEALEGLRGAEKHGQPTSSGSRQPADRRASDLRGAGPVEEQRSGPTGWDVLSE